MESIQDFEGRTIEPGGELGTLTITGAPAHVILRWRFAAPHTVTVKRRTVPALRTTNGVSIEFDDTDKTALSWR